MGMVWHSPEGGVLSAIGLAARCKQTADTSAPLPGLYCGAVQARPELADPLTADEPLANAATIRGCIALVVRGGATFGDKIKHAAEAGAVGVVIINDNREDPHDVFPLEISSPPMRRGGPSGGPSPWALPCLMVSYQDGQALVRHMPAALALAPLSEAGGGGGDTLGRVPRLLRPSGSAAGAEPDAALVELCEALVGGLGLGGLARRTDDGFLAQVRARLGILFSHHTRHPHGRRRALTSD